MQSAIAQLLYCMQSAISAQLLTIIVLPRFKTFLRVLAVQLVFQVTIALVQPEPF